MRESSFLDLISRRSSRRDYLPEPLTPEDGRRVREIIARPAPSPFQSQTRFQLIEVTFAPGAEPVRLGTYGTIRGAHAFIAGAVKAGGKDLEDFGYQMEEIILRVTALGLGTCWLGGAFDRGAFASQIEIRPDELLPAVTPAGYVPEQRGLQDHLLRWGAKSRTRKPFETLFFETDFNHPLTAAGLGEYARVLEMVRLGPSASNKQPWRMVKESGKRIFHLFLQRNPVYARLSKALLQTVDLQRLDAGIAMCHFELSARELELPGRWEIREAAVPNLPAHADYIATWDGEK